MGKKAVPGGCLQVKVGECCPEDCEGLKWNQESMPTLGKQEGMSPGQVKYICFSGLS